ncbi:hypothetical protein SDC9_150705 [bioreactor metagenome]|uniref:Uncharacterized protein n=1 Tax=bioreactor metagenome TaxID=1076179 RepID=A0A645EN79_9ZZZZ
MLEAALSLTRENDDVPLWADEGSLHPAAPDPAAWGLLKVFHVSRIFGIR